MLVRMPISLHEDLIEAAGAEAVSLNLFICGALAAAVKWQARDPPHRPPAILRRDASWEMWSDRTGRHPGA